jgi:Holliday junction resolvasome RuvABC endonuclease subunit
MTALRILSIDVGIKNLSYCVLTVTENEVTIPNWDNIRVTDSNCNKIKLEELTEELLKALNETFSDTFEADIVLIENQPMLKNGLMKTLSVMIYTYFNMMRLQYGTISEVKFISATNKLKCQKVAEVQTSSTTTYKDRKKLSIEVVKRYLEEISPSRLSWFSQQKKQDDLADSFNQAMHYIENVRGKKRT